MADELAIEDLRGFQVTLECRGCREELLGSTSMLEFTLTSCAEQAGGKVVKAGTYRVDPFKITALIVMNSGHIIAHAWAEGSYMTVDVYSHREKKFAGAIADNLLKEFKPKVHTTKISDRLPPSY